jgi:rhodanese-related sulfurtransferase
MAETREAVRTIAREQLKNKMDRREPFALIETLAPEQFREAHLPGAVNAPPERVKELVPILVPNKQTEVVTYCANQQCHASGDAARELMALGYTNVRHYAGGKQDWRAANLPIERG